MVPRQEIESCPTALKGRDAPLHLRGMKNDGPSGSIRTSIYLIKSEEGSTVNPTLGNLVRPVGFEPTTLQL